jgi:hypothetical protein
MQPTPSQLGQYLNPKNLADRTILLTSEEEVFLQTHSHEYSAPSESPPIPPEIIPTPTIPPLMIPHPNMETPFCIPRIPLRKNVHNPQARVAHNYNLVDDLAQSLVSMSVLEILQSCPTQRESLLPYWGHSTLRILNSSHLISTGENFASPLSSLFKSPLKFRKL